MKNLVPEFVYVLEERLPHGWAPMEQTIWFTEQEIARKWSTVFPGSRVAKYASAIVTAVRRGPDLPAKFSLLEAAGIAHLNWFVLRCTQNKLDGTLDENFEYTVIDKRNNFVKVLPRLDAQRLIVELADCVRLQTQGMKKDGRRYLDTIFYIQDDVWRLLP